MAGERAERHTQAHIYPGRSAPFPLLFVQCALFLHLIWLLLVNAVLFDCKIAIHPHTLHLHEIISIYKYEDLSCCLAEQYEFTVL